MFNFSPCRWILASQIAVTTGLLLSVGVSQGAVDTFEDGNDDGWVRYNPLASQGSGASYSFPPVQTPFGLDYRYRIEGNAPRNPEVTGSSRAGSFRTDILPHADGVAWRLHGWDVSANQTFGAFAGIRFEQDNTFDGFGFTYSTSGLLSISQFENGVSTMLVGLPITLDSSLVYRFVFSTSAPGGLTGRLYKGPDFITPIAQIETIVPSFVNGASGFYLFANDPNSGIGATFDNFEVGIVPEPSILSILALGGLCAFWAGRSRINR